MKARVTLSDRGAEKNILWDCKLHDGQRVTVVGILCGNRKKNTQSLLQSS
jgi:hypothetical protein